MKTSNNGDVKIDTGRSASKPQNLSIDDIMWRVREEVARRSAGTATGAGINPADIRSFDQAMPTRSLPPKWTSVVPRPPQKEEYALEELLAFSDAEFIDVAYSAILRRPSDENGRSHYLELLRTGAATKVEILGTLRSCQEGERAGVRIIGLRLPYALQQWRRKRFIGPIISWVYAILRLSMLTDRLSASEARCAWEIQEVGRTLDLAAEYLLQRILSLKLQLANCPKGAEFEALNGEHAAVAASLAALTASVESRLQSVEAPVQHMMLREQIEVDAVRNLDPFYAAFEDRFRESRSVIRARLEPYLLHLQEAGTGTAEAPVLDVGCGRGDWLELLRENGLTGWGIDANRIFIDMCRSRGLDVIEGDGIENLQAVSEKSVGAITSMHVVEHLPFKSVIALLDEARRVLRPGGLLILETPNPENLSVGHHLFYLDPTHGNPLPPEALRWIVESRGFDGVRIERLTTAREWNTPPLLPPDIPGAESMNAVLTSLRAAPDYAIVARRRNSE